MEFGLVRYPLSVTSTSVGQDSALLTVSVPATINSVDFHAEKRNKTIGHRIGDAQSCYVLNFRSLVHFEVFMEVALSCSTTSSLHLAPDR